MQKKDIHVNRHGTEFLRSLNAKMKKKKKKANFLYFFANDRKALVIVQAKHIKSAPKRSFLSSFK